MSNIKYEPIEQLSGWMEYKLLGVEDKLEPPVFRCRLRPLTELSTADGTRFGIRGVQYFQSAGEIAINAIAEWDLVKDGIPIPPTPENKNGYMPEIIGKRVDGREDGILLGIAILLDAQDRENFLKNLPPSSPGITT